LFESEFDRILLEAVDDALSSLSDSVKQMVYFHLERSFHIKREDIPCKFEEFTRAIESIFGVGADWIEVLIMKRIHKKVGGVYSITQRFGLTEYVVEAKRFSKRAELTCNLGVSLSNNVRRFESKNALK
jgi:hypothetical protein